MGKEVRAKKHLGQHFLRDEGMAQDTADLVNQMPTNNWIEIGPGMGVLTKYLLQKDISIKVVELDRESVAYLHQHYPTLEVLEGDFLQLKLEEIYPSDFGVIGNFPYNISSQILFKILDYREQVAAFAGMFQLEVAQRVASPPNSKVYGILSVLVQAFYHVQMEFKIPPHVFSPPPKVWSAVISGKRIEQTIDWNVPLFFKVVKAAFQQRRKTVWNALRQFNIPKDLAESNHLFKLRAENLSVEDFKALTHLIDELSKG